MVVVQLGQAGGHFAAAGAGGGDDHQRPGGLDIVIFAETVVGYDVGQVVGVAGNGIVEVDLDAQFLQTALEGVGSGLTGILGDGDAAHVQTLAAEGVDEAEHVLIVGNAKITAHFVLLNGGGVDDDDHLHALPQLQQHTDLAVGLEAGQDTGGVVVVEELTAEFHVELAAELGDTLPDVGGLSLQIFLVVKADLFRHGLSRV